MGILSCENLLKWRYKMTEFLSGNNPCEKSVLSLVSKGNCIIAQLLKIKDSIPAEFK